VLELEFRGNFSVLGNATWRLYGRVVAGCRAGTNPFSAGRGRCA